MSCNLVRNYLDISDKMSIILVRLLRVTTLHQFPFITIFAVRHFGGTFSITGNIILIPPSNDNSSSDAKN